MGYAYDELNRLAAVNDVHLGVTSYNYDDVGNLQGCTYPNYVHAEYQYDSLNRLTNLASDRLSTAIANYAYAVAVSGNRTNAIEQLFSSALNSTAQTTGFFDRFSSWTRGCRSWEIFRRRPLSRWDFPPFIVSARLAIWCR